MHLLKNSSASSQQWKKKKAINNHKKQVNSPLKLLKKESSIEKNQPIVDSNEEDNFDFSGFLIW